MKKALIFNILFVFCAVFTFGQTPTASPSPTATPTATPAPGTLEGEKLRADRLQSRFNDYAQYKRYADADAKTPAPAKDENRVVFMGDSITDFWKLNEFFPNQPFHNRGISAQTTTQMLLRFRPDVVNLKPKVVVVLAGTNDIAAVTGTISLENTEGNLASMVEIAKANGIKVVFASLLPISDYNKNKAGEAIVRSVQRPPAQILALNQWLKNYAAQNDLIYLDYHSALADEKGFLKPDLANDGLHPNAKGYEVMKPLAEAAINAALKQKQNKKK